MTDMSKIVRIEPGTTPPTNPNPKPSTKICIWLNYSNKRGARTNLFVYCPNAVGIS